MNYYCKTNMYKSYRITFQTRMTFYHEYKHECCNSFFTLIFNAPTYYMPGDKAEKKLSYKNKKNITEST